MRIIFLNAWYGKVGAPFYEFVKKYSGNCDIFCFQEASPALFSKLESILPKHTGSYETDGRKNIEGETYGEAVFIRKEIGVLSSGRKSIYPQSIQNLGFLQYIFVRNGFFIGNVHGTAYHPDDKLDTDRRIKQSYKILDFFKSKKGAKIIGGDFNLMPDTRSIKMLEEAGYRNLIKDFKIKATRNRLAWDQFPDEEKQYFADYVFVSPEVKVKNFSVPNLEISDHLPLILEFQI